MRTGQVFSDRGCISWRLSVKNDVIEARNNETLCHGGGV